MTPISIWPRAWRIKFARPVYPTINLGPAWIAKQVWLPMITILSDIASAIYDLLKGDDSHEYLRGDRQPRMNCAINMEKIVITAANT